MSNQKHYHFWINTIKNRLYDFLYTQLFITIATLPILVAWGLPFSLMSFLSNLLFTPFLSLFLLMCSLIFFTTLLSMPNTWLMSALEFFTSAIYYCLEHNSSSWLIGFKKQYLAVLYTITLSAFTIVHYQKYSMRQALKILILLFGVLLFLLKFQSNNNQNEVMHLSSNHHNQPITILRINNTIILIDAGTLARNCSLDDWFEYTLTPWLNQHAGSNIIEHCIIMRPTKRVLQSLQTALNHITFKNIYIPYWYGDAESSFIRAYARLIKLCAQSNIQIHRIGNRTKIINISNNTITIKPLNEKINYQDITFQACLIETSINNNQISVVPLHTKQPPAA